MDGAGNEHVAQIDPYRAQDRKAERSFCARRRIHTHHQPGVHCCAASLAGRSGRWWTARWRTSTARWPGGRGGGDAWRHYTMKITLNQRPSGIALIIVMIAG